MQELVTQADKAALPAALLGIATPIGCLPGLGSGGASTVAIVSALLGTLSADPMAGAIVRGSGSPSLWLSGSSAQINAALATLTYLGRIAGTDQISLAVLDRAGSLTSLPPIPLAVLPFAGLPGPASRIVYVESGTITLDTVTLDGPDLNLRESESGPTAATLVLVNSTIGVHSHLTIRNDNAVDGRSPRLAIAGRVAFDGTVTFAGSGTAISLAQGALLHNEGTMEIGAHAARFTGAGTFVNDGVILVTGDDEASALVRIETALAGTGTLALTAGASVSLGAAVGAGETVELGAGRNTLHLGRPDAFDGQIAGFSRGDTLVFDGAPITDAIFTRSAEAGNVIVSLFNGALAAGTVRFSAPEAGTVFQFGADADGNSALWLVAAPGPHSRSVEVFRFFDTAHGTQLLTQMHAERDSIVESRPDLRFEGVGLHALDPAQPGPDAAPVFRFFDSGNGTHFMTASTAERDTVLATRPDLIFEPSSTMFEHATAQAGDAAVYRFFDRGNGAHLFTADPGERASILATRPDMAFEGIAFYAPTA